MQEHNAPTVKPVDWVSIERRRSVVVGLGKLLGSMQGGEWCWASDMARWGNREKKVCGQHIVGDLSTSTDS